MESDTAAAVGRRLTPKGEATRAPVTTPKGEATRARIVAAAAALIAQNGIARTSNEAVREAAGVSGSQLSSHFAGKDELVRAVIAHQGSAVLESMRRRRVEQPGSLAGLRAWASGVVSDQGATQCERGCRYGALAGELIETDPATRDHLATGFAQWHSEFAQLLDAMVESGELLPGSPTDRLASCLLAALQGGLLLSVSSRTTAPLEAALDAAIAHVASHASIHPSRANPQGFSVSDRSNRG